MTGIVKHVLEPKSKSLGAFSVRRVLPSAKQKMVGPFVFFDHFGPTDFPPGKGIDVRPHPHIGLATVSYLFEGAMLHRDTLGTEIEIHPGAVNWMTAGKGISHSERTPAEIEAKGHKLHGIQTWVALPKTHEDIPPAFEHHPSDTLPETEVNDIKIRMIAGSGFGMTSPVSFPHPIFYAAMETDTEGSFELPADVEELALYVAEGTAEIAGETYTSGQMVIFESGAQAAITLGKNTKAMLAGGGTMDGRRWVEWNFVASDPALIEQAKADWRASIAGNWTDTPFAMPPKENEYIPLPGDPEG